ncbi:hypothetical protein ACOMHN_050028 [Nucella lapillus]
MSAVTPTTPLLQQSSSSSPLLITDSDLFNVSASAGWTLSNDTDDERNEGLAVIEVAISGTILFLAVAGNSIVVVSLMVKRGKLSRMHLMMLHLSLADLSVAFFQVLPQMVWDITFRFQGGAFLCGAVKYLQLVTMYGSSYVLLSTAVDRYVAICRPFLSQKWTSTHAHLLVLAAWSASLVFSLPQIFIFSLSDVSEGSGVYDCWASFHPPWTLKLYIAWNALSVFLAPSMTLAVLYGHISLTVWRSSKMAENLAHSVFLAPSMTLAVLYGHISLTVWRSSKMAENLAHRYKPVSKGPKEATKTHDQSEGRAALTHGVSAWHHHTVPTSATSDSRHTHPLQNLHHSGPSHDAETRHNHPATKPWNGRPYTDAGSVQKFPGHYHHGHAALTQTLSDCRGCNFEEKATSSSFTTVNVAPSSARSPGDRENSNDTFYKGTSQENRNSTHGGITRDIRGRSADGQKAGASRSSHGNGHSVDVQRTKPCRLSQELGTSRTSMMKSGAQDAHTWGTKRGTGGGVGISRAKIKTIKLTLTVVICYLMCWTPFYVAQLWAAYDENVPYDSIFFTVVLLLASVNSCTNPWIYMVFSDTICNTLRAIADSHSCFRSPSSSSSSSSTRGRYSYNNCSATCRASVLSSERSSTNSRVNHGHANGVSRI